MTMMGPTVLGRIGASLYWAGLVASVSSTHGEGGCPNRRDWRGESVLAAAVVVVTCSTRQNSQLASWQAKTQRWCGGGGGYRDEIHPNGHRRTSGLAVGVVRPAARPRRSLAFKV